MKAALMEKGRIALRRGVGNALLFAAFTVGGFATVAHGDDKAGIARGQELAELHCLGCHTLDAQNELRIENVPVPSFSAIARQPNQTSERVQNILQIPHRPMPAIPLSSSDIRDITAYVMSFRH